jgi:signal transduction histidine kinase
MLPPEQLAEVAELAGGFIHEVKNHVSTLNLNLQLLADDFAEPQTPRERRAKQRIDRLLNQSARLGLERLSSLRAFTRTKRRRAHRGRSGEMVDFFGPTARSTNITISLCGPGVPPVMLDRELFKQPCLLMLTRSRRCRRRRGVLQRSENDLVCLDIIDSGIGIEADELTKIFRPFHTTKPGGTGLGLATTRKIVQAHGGEIEAQSEPGHGTKFTIRLPKVVEAIR